MDAVSRGRSNNLKLVTPRPTSDGSTMANARVYELWDEQSNGICLTNEGIDLIEKSAVIE